MFWPKKFMNFETRWSGVGGRIVRQDGKVQGVSKSQHNEDDGY